LTAQCLPAPSQSRLMFIVDHLSIGEDRSEFNGNETGIASATITHH
jgi:hypothetical protein